MTRNTGEWRSITEHCPPPCPFIRGNGGIGTFSQQYHGSIHCLQTTWKKIVSAIHAPRRFRIVLYNFCFYFWGQHCCWPETSIIGNDLLALCFHCDQLFHWIPCPAADPACLLISNLLWQRHKHSCGYFKSIQTQLSAICLDNDIGWYVISAKSVTDDRKHTLLANSHTLPPEYDFWKDANRARAFMGKCSWYRKSKTFY